MINTLLVILEQSLMHLPLMLGAYVSFSLIKVPDLSIESAYVVGALLGSQILIKMQNLPLGIAALVVIIVSCAGGALVGLTSSLLTQKGSLPHLLSTIITFGLFHGMSQLIAPAYLSLSLTNNPLLIGPAIPQHPELITLASICCVIMLSAYFLFKTQLGYSYAVYGNNSYFFKNYGISTSFIFLTGITLANSLAGLSGYLIAQSNNFAELNMGLGKALLCITALIVGKRFVHSKKPLSLAVPLVGTIAYFTIQQLLLKAGFNLKYFTAVQALLVLCLLLVSSRKKPNTTNDALGV